MWFFGSWVVPPPKKKQRVKEPTALISGISFCSGQQLIKNCNWSKAEKKIESSCSVLNGISILTSHPRLREHHSRGTGKKERGGGWERVLWKTVFWSWHGMHLWVHQGSQCFNGWRRHSQPPTHTHTLPEELLAADGCWVKEKQCSVVDCLCPHRSPHPCAYWQH